MRGQDADDRDPAAAKLPAGDRQLEREGAGAADDLLAVERGVHPLERQIRAEALGLLEGRPAAEIVADRADRIPKLFDRGDLTDVHRQAIFSNGA